MATLLSGGVNVVIPHMKKSSVALRSSEVKKTLLGGADVPDVLKVTMRRISD